MASGSTGGRHGGGGSGTKGFDFASSDDILCSYEDYAAAAANNQDMNNNNNNGSIHSDSALGSDSTKEFHKSRMARSSIFPASSYSPPEVSGNQDVISAVERSMKRYTDDLMRFLEGLSSRMSQLELYCYNLDKSIGEMRADMVRNHGEADSKLKSVEKHLHEVHRSVQILRDKQELADTQKELAKLQLAQKESSSATKSEQTEEQSATPDKKKSENQVDPRSQQLALALPRQVASQQPTPPTRPVDPQPAMLPQTVPQSQAYYIPPTQITNTPVPAQFSQGPYLPQPDPQSQVNQPQTQMYQLPQYQQQQQQWAPQLPQQAQPPQPPMQAQPPQPSMQAQPPQPSMQAQARPSSPSIYPPYIQSQPMSQPLPETHPSSASMQMPPQQMPYGYGGVGRTTQPQMPSQQMGKTSYGGQPSDGYNAYRMYDGEGGRAQHPMQLPPHYQQSGFPPSPSPMASSSAMVRPPQYMPKHAYNELIDKLVSMGYRGDHVLSVIQRLEESGQPVDFNAVLDRLNGHSSGGSQRGWSG